MGDTMDLWADKSIWHFLFRDPRSRLDKTAGTAITAARYGENLRRGQGFALGCLLILCVLLFSDLVMLGRGADSYLFGLYLRLDITGFALFLLFNLAYIFLKARSHTPTRRTHLLLVIIPSLLVVGWSAAISVLESSTNQGNITLLITLLVISLLFYTSPLELLVVYLFAAISFGLTILFTDVRESLFYYEDIYMVGLFVLGWISSRATFQQWVRLNEQQLTMRSTNRELTHEVQRRREVERSLRELTQKLEQRVEERTKELSEANEDLRAEIRDRLNTEKELAMFRLFVESSAQGFAMSDLDGKLLFVNERFAHLLGEETADGMLGNRLEAHMPKDSLLGLFPGGKLELGEHGQWVQEIRLESHNRALDALLNIFRISDSHGDPVRLAIVITDVTDLKRVEGALAASEKRYHTLFENAGDAYFLMRGDRFVESNLMARKMFQLSSLELARMHPWEVSPPEQGENRPSKPLAETRMKAALEGKPQQFEWVHRRADGELFDADVTLHRVDLFGHPYLLAGVRDISERKRAEEALRSSEEKLQHAQKMEAVGRLAGGVAHDFNNLLTALSGNVDLASQDLAPQHPVQEHLEELRTITQRAARLTRQLLAFSRRQEMAPRHINLNETIGELEKMLGRLIGENIQLTTALEESLPQVLADPSQVEQIIVNLVVNARDAMPSGGELLLRTRSLSANELPPRLELPETAERWVEFTVQDNGTGMSEELLQHIFEPFFTTKGEGQGTGLGLATVYGIVQQSGGEIHVASRPGQGTSFHIYLPATTGEEEETQHQQQNGQLRGRGEWVLLVEDEPAVRNLIRRLLEQRGFRVIEAMSAEAALAKTRREALQVDVLISDIVLPGSTGVELAKTLRGDRPRLPVIFISGYAENEVVHEGRNELKAPLLLKPFRPSELIRLLREQLETAEPKA